MSNLRVLCWGHRRATEPLRAAAAAYREERPDTTFQIDVRPLSAFEHQGIEGVAREYDLVVFDHPFCGDITARGAFLPLDLHLPSLLGDGSDDRYVGASLSSYRFAGSVWGAPIDAATQHALVRGDLLEAACETVPRSWHDALALGDRLKPRALCLGLAVETPHALLTLASLMANAGRPWSTDPAEPLTIDSAAFLEAMRLVRQLLAFCPPEALSWNSIDLHEAMVERDDIAYCPCVYGYATYGEADQRKPLRFGDFAGARAPYEAGSAIGGTALGVSRFSSSTIADEAISFVRFMLEPRVQDQLIPSFHGQPALGFGLGRGSERPAFQRVLFGCEEIDGLRMDPAAAPQIYRVPARCRRSYCQRPAQRNGRSRGAGASA